LKYEQMGRSELLHDGEFIPRTHRGHSAETRFLTTFPARFSIRTQGVRRLFRGLFRKRGVAVSIGLDKVHVG